MRPPSGVVKALLKAGASLEAEDASSLPPLSCAILIPDEVNMNVVKALLEAGASLEAGPNALISLRPMDAAIWKGNVEVVETLIEAGASLDRQDWRVARFAVFTPLEFAISQGNLNVIKVLLYTSLTAY